MSFMDKLAHYLENADSSILYMLAMICGAMIVDFLMGTIAAKVNPEIDFISKKGIDGILRKIASVMLLIYFIPLAPLVPNGAGVAFLYVLYLGYLLNELNSILENYKKMGYETELFTKFLSFFRKDDSEE